MSDTHVDVRPEVTPERPAPGRRRRQHRSMRQRVGQFDVRNTWQVAAGAVLIPLGVAIILLAWYGAAHARYVQQQMPYLVSGSFVGLGCMIVGGLFFWAHWLYRLYDQADLHHEQRMQADAELRSILADLAGGRAGVVSNHSSRVPSADDPWHDEALVATPSGTFYHLPTCPVAQQRRERLRPVSEHEAMAMRPCRICDPPHIGNGK